MTCGIGFLGPTAAYPGFVNSEICCDGMSQRRAVGESLAYRASQFPLACHVPVHESTKALTPFPFVFTTRHLAYEGESVPFLEWKGKISRW